LNKLHAIGKVINTLAALPLPGGAGKRLAGSLAVKLFISPRRIPIRPEVQSYLDSAQALEVKLAHRLTGYSWPAKQQPARGRVLLIHGWESHAGRWVPLIEKLRDHGYDTVAFDGPAAGRSEGRTTPFNVYIDYLQEVERVHGPFDAYVGHSLGAGVAIQLCQRVVPQRQPQHLVVMGCFDESHHVFDRYHNMLGLNDKVREAFDAHIVSLINDKGGETLGIHDFSNTASAKTLAAVRAMIVHSKDDKVSPYAEGKAIHAAWPGSRLVTFKNEGHRLRGEQVNEAILSFLLSE
jgi:pimeloyl-ACP methyl ester carboxylesterase